MTLNLPNCHIYGQRFHDENSLKAHKYAHIRPFEKCEVCKCEIINNHTIELHFQNKHGQAKSYKCNKCEKKYLYLSAD